MNKDLSLETESNEYNSVLYCSILVSCVSQNSYRDTVGQSSFKHFATHMPQFYNCNTLSYQIYITGITPLTNG